MSDLENFVNRADKNHASALIDMALVHYQFETIHPFADGNGRVGRMLISLMAVTENLLEKPVLYMSPELETRKGEYIDLMYQVSATVDWESWLKFFLDVLASSCWRAIFTIDRVIQLQTQFKEHAANASRSNNI